MKKILFKLHLWTGLVASLVLLVVSVTGMLLVFEKDLDGGRKTHLKSQSVQSWSLSLSQQARLASSALEGASLLQVRVGGESPNSTEFRFDKGRRVVVDAGQGRVLQISKREGSFFRSSKSSTPALSQANWVSGSSA